MGGLWTEWMSRWIMSCLKPTANNRFQTTATRTATHIRRAEAPCVWVSDSTVNDCVRRKLTFYEGGLKKLNVNIRTWTHFLSAHTKCNNELPSLARFALSRYKPASQPTDSIARSLPPTDKNRGRRFTISIKVDEENISLSRSRMKTQRKPFDRSDS